MESLLPLFGCLFKKFQAQSFESCRRATNPVDDSTVHHNDGGRFQPKAKPQPDVGRHDWPILKTERADRKRFGEGNQTLNQTLSAPSPSLQTSPTLLGRRFFPSALVSSTTPSSSSFRHQQLLPPQYLLQHQHGLCLVSPIILHVLPRPPIYHPQLLPLPSPQPHTPAPPHPSPIESVYLILSSVSVFLLNRLFTALPFPTFQLS